MVKEEDIIKIINNEFDKIFKSINSISQADNNPLSQQKIFVMKFYKNIELAKSNILLNIKNYFSNTKSINTKIKQINQFTKFFQSQKRNRSQNILNFHTNVNINPKYRKNIFYSIIDGSLSDLKKNHSYLSPSLNKKNNKIKPIIIDAKNIRAYKGINSSNNTNSNTTTGINNLNINANNSNNYNNYNINNLNSSEEGESQVKVICSKKDNSVKNNLNYILNKSHSELKLRLKDRKNNYSSNKVCHQKKKISLAEEIINMGLFNKEKKNKNKNNLKILTNSVIGEVKSEKNVSFSIKPTKNVTQSFWRNSKKKIIINKINLQKRHFNTKTEILNKKKKMLNFSSNFYIIKNNNNKGINNNSFKRNMKKLKNNGHSLNNNISNNNNSLNNNIIDNYDESINENNDLAKEIINFLDNFKNLQNSIIKKDSDTKKMKINLEIQKNALYKKAKNILDSNIHINNCNNNINNNDSKLNISNNSKGLNSTTVKSDSLSYINNYFGNNIKNNLSGITIKNINNKNNESNTKELNLSIINLKKKIQDMKINDELMNEQLKNEIKILKNKLNEKEQSFLKLDTENLDKIMNIYKNLLLYSNNKNIINCQVPNDKKFDWYIHQINDVIEESGKEWQKINNAKEKNRSNYINENLIKEQLYKATIDIIKWLQPYMELNNNDIKKYSLKLEEDFKEYGIKQALNSLKSKIKELVYLLETNNINKNQENLLTKTNFNNIISKKEFSKLNSIILNIQNKLMKENEIKNNEIQSIKNDLNNSLKLNDKITSILNNYFPQEMRIFQEKYDYILSLLNAEQDKVNLLQKEYIEMLEGLIEYIDNGNKIYVELGKFWNIKPKNETNFIFIEPDPSELGHLSESDLLSAGSKKGKEGNLDLEKYKEEIEQYKKVFKYLENKMSKYDTLFNDITNIVIKIAKNMQVNQKQKELFCSLFRILNIKDEKIISFFKISEDKK